LALPTRPQGWPSSFTREYGIETGGERAVRLPSFTERGVTVKTYTLTLTIETDVEDVFELADIIQDALDKTPTTPGVGVARPVREVWPP
jgi:hypothetical protein